jgi:hypothetical protein
MLLWTLIHLVAPCTQGLHYGDKYSSLVLRFPYEAGKHHRKGSAYFPLLAGTKAPTSFSSPSILVNEEESRESGTEWDSASTQGLHLTRIHSNSTDLAGLREGQWGHKTGFMGVRLMW